MGKLGPCRGTSTGTRWTWETALRQTTMKGFRQKSLKGTSRALGTCGIRLWLLPSGPDQVPGPQCEEARPLAIVYEAGRRANRGARHDIVTTRPGVKGMY